MGEMREIRVAAQEDPVTTHSRDLISYRDAERVRMELAREEADRQEAVKREEKEREQQHARAVLEHRKHLALSRGFKAAGFGGMAFATGAGGVALMAGASLSRTLQIVAGIEILYLAVVFVVTAILYSLSATSALDPAKQIHLEEK